MTSARRHYCHAIAAIFRFSLLADMPPLLLCRCHFAIIIFAIIIFTIIITPLRHYVIFTLILLLLLLMTRLPPFDGPDFA